MAVPNQTRTPDQKRKRVLRMLQLAAFLLLVGALIYLYATRRAAEVSIPQPQVSNTSTGVYPEKPPEKAADPVREGDLEVNPGSLDMGVQTVDLDQFTGSFSVRAKDARAVVKEVRVPFARDQGVEIDASPCVNVAMSPGESCPVSVVYAPHRPGTINVQATVTAELTRSDGSPRTVTAVVGLTGQSVKPPANAAAAAPVAPAEKPREAVVEAGPSQDALDYIRRRTRPGNLAMQFDAASFGFLSDQDPKQDDWKSLGYGTNLSSMPVDMSRVVTMDKPIPAVIKLPIDSRMPSRAVAIVERDIYGGDGRLVVIERGSTLIGTAAAVGSTAEEKVGISWERLVRPDGSAWTFQATSGDAMGRSGVIGYIDQRWFERFGVSLLASAAVSGIDIAINATQKTDTATSGVTTSTQTPAYVASQQFSSNFQALFAQFEKEQLQIPPIRTIPVGTRITVFPTTDLWLRPEKPTDDMRAAYARNAKGSAEAQAAQNRAQQAATLNKGFDARPSASGLAANPVGTAGRSAYLGAAVDPNGPAASGMPTSATTPLTPQGSPDLASDSDTGAGAGHAGFASDPTAAAAYAAKNPNPLPASTMVPAGSSGNGGGFASSNFGGYNGYANTPGVGTYPTANGTVFNTAGGAVAVPSGSR